MKEYYESNKEVFRNKNKKRYQINKEVRKEKYNSNKEQLAEKVNSPICNKELNKSSLFRHNKHYHKPDFTLIE